jgi:hypothetical protein
MADRFVAFDETQHVREEAKGFDSFVFYGARNFDGEGPQMYMNRVDPSVELAAHFHRIDQFQVFFGTPGSIFQRRPIPELFLHYTDAYSSYGPFRASEATPLLYATIRARSSNYGGVMPGARAERPYRGRRQLSSPVGSYGLEHCPAPGQADVVEIFAPDTDGLAADLHRLGAGGSLDLPDAARTSGQAICIVAGGLSVDGREFGPRSLGWRGQEDAAATVGTAGANGCSALILSFPYPATQDLNLPERA